MKVSKKGEPLCEKGEVRVGNFFVKAESGGMVKVCDLSGLLVHRVSGVLPVGVLLSDAVTDALACDGKASDFLHLYCSVVYLFSTVVPMVESGEGGFNFWSEAHAFLQRAADASKALYGVKGEPSESEDSEALEDVKDAVALEEEIAGMEVPGE